MAKNKDSASYGIIGLGRFGTALAKSLAAAGKDVMIIDSSEAKVRELRQYTEHAFVAHDLGRETLEEAGIQNCDTVVVCIGEKIDTSILTTLNVVSLGVPNVIAKAISEDQGAVLEKSARRSSTLSATWRCALPSACFPAACWIIYLSTAILRYRRYASRKSSLAAAYRRPICAANLV